MIDDEMNDEDAGSDYSTDPPPLSSGEDYRRNCQKTEEVYADVHREFYAWKADYNQVQLSYLPLQLRIPASLTTDTERVEFNEHTHPSSGASELEFLCAWEYDDDGRLVAQERVPLREIKAKRFPPHPPYRFCTPTLRYHTARMWDSRVAPFAPFPEDSAFPRDKFFECFEGVQWVSDMSDPDDEVIKYETVRRLHLEQGLTAQAINEVLRFHMGLKPLRDSDVSGLLWEVSQRDFPPVIWADGLDSSRRPQLPPHFAQDICTANDIFEHINSGMMTFCPRLNCVVHFCKEHISYEWRMLTLPVPEKQPFLMSQEFFDQSEPPCGKRCFRLLNFQFETDDVDGDRVDYASVDSLEFLKSFLKLNPDALPCDLAIICRTTCQQAFIHRRELINDNNVISRKPPRSNIKRSQTNVGNSSSVLLEYGHCDHTAPCEFWSCRCIQLRMVCTKACSCHGGSKCRQGFKGCDKTCANNRTCGVRKGRGESRRDKQCACLEAGRECDPELCTKCNARSMQCLSDKTRGRTNACQNIALQSGKFKPLAIKRAQYGLGAFAVEHIKAGDIIGEYVGELLHLDLENVNFMHRVLIHNHTKMNYWFDMAYTAEGGTKIVVDSQWIGNPTRFLNDARPGESNCSADYKEVNGDRRLFLRAMRPIEPKKELTLSYGPAYWSGHEVEQQSSAELDLETE